MSGPSLWRIPAGPVGVPQYGTYDGSTFTVHPTFTPDPPSRKETPMSELEEARADLAKWSKKVAKHRRSQNESNEKLQRALSFERDARSRVARLELPEEPRPGSVIRFVKRFHGRSTVFVYVATRAPGQGKWYCTGYSAPQQVTWAAMVAYIRRDNLAPFGFEILTSTPANLSSGSNPF